MDELLDLSKKLISIPSTKDNPEALKQVLQVAREALPNITCEAFLSEDHPSLLFYNSVTRPEKFKVLLNGHLDVVAAKPEQYQAKVLDGKLWGRGAIDMKAATAAELLAFKTAADKVNYPLALQLVTDEETGGFNGVGFQVKQGIVADLYMCGEYSDLDISYQAKGVLWLKLITAGTRAHGAYLWNGVNAIAKLSDEIQVIKKIFPVPKNPVWKTTCNFGKISAGDAFNQVPDTAFVGLDIRRVPTQTAAEILAKIKDHLVYPDTRIEIVEDEPANTTNYKHPLIAQLAKTIRKHTHSRVKYVRFNGASDARYYSAAGVTAIDFGPAGEGLHSDAEWVDLESLTKYHKILVDFLLYLPPA